MWAGESRHLEVPTALAEVQAWMVSAITLADVREDEVQQVLTAGPRQSALERLDVYRADYVARLVECLRDDYPVLADTLGESRFRSLAEAYIAAHPSDGPNLNYFGRNMAALCLEAELECAPAGRTFFSELASLEWALVLVLHGETPQPFDLATLQAIPIGAWSAARLIPSDAARLLVFQHPVNAYYQACRMGERPPSLPVAGPSATVVYRHELTLWRMDLTPAMTDVLRALLGGTPIGPALERMTTAAADPEALAEAERNIMVWFREWVNAGIFGGVELAP